MENNWNDCWNDYPQCFSSYYQEDSRAAHERVRRAEEEYPQQPYWEDAYSQYPEPHHSDFYSSPYDHYNSRDDYYYQPPPQDQNSEPSLAEMIKIVENNTMAMQQEQQEFQQEQEEFRKETRAALLEIQEQITQYADKLNEETILEEEEILEEAFEGSRNEVPVMLEKEVILTDLDDLEDETEEIQQPGPSEVLAQKFNPDPEVISGEEMLEEMPDVKDNKADLIPREESSSKCKILEESDGFSSEDKEEIEEVEFSEDFSPDFCEDFAAVPEEIQSVMEIEEEILSDFKLEEVKEIKEEELKEQIDPVVPVEVKGQVNLESTEETSSEIFSEHPSKDAAPMVPVVIKEFSAQVLEQEPPEGAKTIKGNFSEPKEKEEAEQLQKSEGSRLVPCTKKPRKGKPKKRPKFQRRGGRHRFRKRKKFRGQICLHLPQDKLLPGRPKPLVLIQDLFLGKLKTRWKED